MMSISFSIAFKVAFRFMEAEGDILTEGGVVLEGEGSMTGVPSPLL